MTIRLGSMAVSSILLRYVAFAVIATLANLGAQRIVLSLGEGVAIFVAAVFWGTLVGLVVKYMLDKRWIFADHSTGLANHGRKFSLYTAMGIVTTAIFWGSETLFWLLWKTDLMRETGAVLGLGIGYFVKFRLDRRYVFTDGPALGAGGR
ncbi:GtrA family protein [Primorskyibacter sedentarius]|uniref:GtrA family protein n=1 Tax=Primorskyibacter sedentarius TaxID=745311 RepID=UPI003EBAC6D7